MADRITVTTGSGSGVASSAGPRVARYIVAGQTQLGPVAAPRVIRSLTEYQQVFGSRTGGAALYDAAEFFFSNRAGEMVVQRASGPSAVLATIGLDSNKIVVTSRFPGSAYNSWTAAYTSASKTLTIVKGSVTRTYTGADAAGLQSAASVDPDVTVTVTSLPASNVAATNLASGTDDFANVNWATVLAKVTSLYGPGVMAVPGVAAANSALAAAANPRRWALLSSAATDSDSTIVTAQGAITTANRPFASYVTPPAGFVADGTSGVKQIDAVTYFAAVRSLCIRTFGVGESPLRRQAHALVSGFTPIRDIDDATHTTLEAAGVVTVRTLASGVGIDVWKTADGVGFNANLKDARYRDLVNAITDEAWSTLDSLYVGSTASPSVLSAAESALKAVCERYVPWLTGGDGEGYKVSVSPGVAPNDNRIAATISVRFLEGIEWIDLTINVADAGQSI